MYIDNIFIILIFTVAMILATMYICEVYDANNHYTCMNAGQPDMDFY